jgi:predicted nucleic acid-binding protein
VRATIPTAAPAAWFNKGLSRLLIEYASKADWRLITADYCISEVEKNVRKHPAGAVDWERIVRARLEAVGSVYVIDRPIVFDATKDKPVILSAIGSDADYLVTSDTTDFAHILGTVVYGVNVRTPKSFLQEMGVVA